MYVHIRIYARHQRAFAKIRAAGNFFLYLLFPSDARAEFASLCASALCGCRWFRSRIRTSRDDRDEQLRTSTVKSARTRARTWEAEDFPLEFTSGITKSYKVENFSSRKPSDQVRASANFANVMYGFADECISREFVVYVTLKLLVLFYYHLKFNL